MGSAMASLFRLSESRGKESAGLAVRLADSLQVHKAAIPASDLVKSEEYRRITSGAIGTGGVACLIGHSRLVTNGSEDDNRNNQPVHKNGIVGIHNGIIVNDAALWARHPELVRDFEVDTEILLALIRKGLAGSDLVAATRAAFDQIEGAASVALLFEDLPVVLLATNTGSLYWAVAESGAAFVFASERYILERLVEQPEVAGWLGKAEVHQLRARHGLQVRLDLLKVDRFTLLPDSPDIVAPATTAPVPILGVACEEPKPVGIERAASARSRDRALRLLSGDPWENTPLRRCTRCILPETMPFIRFDDSGVCNFCLSHRPIELKGEGALRERVERMRKANGDADCIVTFSGGRDSCYGLHYIKTVLKMNPIAYSYDWGMITDLGRRNQARLCGKLGVEHVLVSADIRAKRAYISKNVKAWLRQPDLGMVPLFMAGDKQFFYYANELSRKTGISLVILCENLLERTDFKSGFCGIAPLDRRAAFYRLPLTNSLKLAAYYARQFLSNPAYLNSSILDTVFAYFAYYQMQHDYLSLYQYIKWDEQEVMQTLRREYDWELATDTTSSWRIGDGTAAFYNFIYYTVAGFTEHDTFRSNQIREGMITRAEALELAREGNLPRVESMDWYCQTIGLDLAEVIATVQKIPRLRPAGDVLPGRRAAR